MKSKAISNKRNIFGIIKETVLGSMADFFKTLGNTETDEMQEEAVTPDVQDEVSKVEATTLDDKKDYVEVTVGKTVNFGGINTYKRKVDPKQVAKAHAEKAKNLEGREKGEPTQGIDRTRGER